ncbi:hypothetical protein IW261DRAFT_1597640 [Armillaria novae-zelandiae]|uniref:DUF6535 domain-containing protein n=1 Tax=Armillaria novae-zelandiae TaxID=153914 RepID=A0AA39NS26_9AGAR|nr:hypothetical protein IW261DRAFT_1597640 [Armillaria novae-zelandiae]
MSDQNEVEEVARRCSSEGISDVQDHPEGSSQNHSSKLHQSNEEKPEKVEIGKGEIDSDSIGVERLSSPGIQEEAAVRDDRGAEKSRPDSGLNLGNDRSNYEEKYHKDKVYEETKPNARVWKTYVDESKNHDARMDRESRESLDVLLVFAGLFSAVVTTFVAQTSQSLQADYAQVSASLLFEMVLIQRAVANGSSLDNVPVSSLNPFTAFTPATTDVWVNGLWFTSLSLSLATALVAVLVKQWLHHYLALPSGTSPQEQSHARQFRYGGFQKWHVLVIIGLLPVLMHLALGIFFVGLTIFLVPLRPGFSWVIGVGTVVAYVTYLISIFLPILYPQCPYHTPLSDLIYFPYHYITQDLFPKHVRPFFMKAVEWPHSTVEKPRANISSLDDLERGAVQEQSDTLSVEALHWLFSSSSNPTVHAVVIQSIGGLPVSAMAAVKNIFGEAKHIRQVHCTLLDGSTQYVGRGTVKPLPEMECKVERLLRFELFIPHLETDWYERIPLRHYIEPADHERLALAVQSNDALQRSSHKPSDSPTSTAFFQEIISSGSSPDLPPVIWLGLMRAAKGDGAFDPINIDSLDVFPLLLCRYIVFRKNPIVRQDSSSLVSFWSAVADNFPEEFATNMLNMLSVFNHLADKTLFPTTFTLALASIRYLLHRISLPSSDIDPEDTLENVLERFYFNVAFDKLPDEQITAFSDVMEYAIIRSSVFKPKPGWMGAQMILVHVYLAMHGVQTVYNVFLETDCLDVFRGHSLRPSLVGVINAYIAGLATPHASIDFQRHLDYLHKPENLFLVCCVLSTNGWEDFSELPSEAAEIERARLRLRVCRDIRALTRLRRSDPSWDQCRRKLGDLLQVDEGEFFVNQQRWTTDGFEVLKPEDIHQAKRNIYLALTELYRSDTTGDLDATARINGMALLRWYTSVSTVPSTS